MGDMDNDFSDLYDLLYADVEVQASSAITGVPSVSQLDLQEVGNDKESSGSGSKSVDSSSEENGEKEAIVDVGSDTEDDLNIVLNNSDDDSKDGGVEEEENGGFGGSDLNKNPKNVDQLEVVDGLQQSFNGEAEKGDARKYGYHSQYKVFLCCSLNCLESKFSSAMIHLNFELKQYLVQFVYASNFE